MRTFITIMSSLVVPVGAVVFLVVYVMLQVGLGLITGSGVTFDNVTIPEWARSMCRWGFGLWFIITPILTILMAIWDLIEFYCCKNK